MPHNSHDSFRGEHSLRVWGARLARYQLVLWTLLPLIILAHHYQSQSATQEALVQLAQMHQRLDHMGTYDLHSLEKSADPIAQLLKLTTRDQQPLKFVSEVALDDRRVREVPLVMPQAALIDSQTAMRILEILQPAASAVPRSDIWIKNMKLRRDKSGFVLQISLLKRELKS